MFLAPSSAGKNPNSVQGCIQKRVTARQKTSRQKNVTGYIFSQILTPGRRFY